MTYMEKHFFCMSRKNEIFNQDMFKKSAENDHNISYSTYFNINGLQRGIYRASYKHNLTTSDL